MTFSEIQYMHWAKTVSGRGTYNLAMSGIGLLATPEELALGAGDIALGGDNFYGYAPLRTAISARYGVPEKNILITQGTSLANFLIAAALVGPGDAVIVEQPTYEPLLSIMAPLGADVRRVGRRREAGFAIDPADVRAVIDTRTKLILLCTLHNPTGMRIPESTLKEIAAIAASVGATVVVDEVYQDFLPGRVAPAFTLAENIVTTNSLTKVYGLGGLRVGWAFASEEIVQRAYSVYNSLGVNNAFPADHLATVLMQRGTTELLASRARERAAKHWPIVQEWLATRSELSCVTPDGGITCFPRFVDGRSATEFCARLQTDFGTTLVPGAFFEEESAFRLGFGCEEAVLREGLSRIAMHVGRVQ